MRDVLLVAGLLVAPCAISLWQYQPSPTVDSKDPRLSRLTQFFAERGCPLREAAVDFLIAADLNHLDWRLLPSISIIESSGGKDFRNNNVFGWDSSRGSFPSVRAGIHFVASKLATSKLYRGKNLESKLQTYNPLPDYVARVKAVMRTLGPESQPVMAED
jgi:hypothetical protein